MSQQELLKRVVDVLDAAGVPYMATGSIVSSLQGEPRSTHDIDLVVAITPAGAQALLKAFPPPDYYLDDLAVREAMRRRDMFNLLDIT
jgi:predicted nucleotidyltransferase